MPPKRKAVPTAGSSKKAKGDVEESSRLTVQWALNPIWLTRMFHAATDDGNKTIRLGLFGSEGGSASKTSGNTKTKLFGKLADAMFDHPDETPEQRARYRKHRDHYIKSLGNYIPKSVRFLFFYVHFVSGDAQILTAFVCSRVQVKYKAGRARLTKTGEGVTEMSEADNIIGQFFLLLLAGFHPISTSHRGAEDGNAMVGRR